MNHCDRLSAASQVSLLAVLALRKQCDAEATTSRHLHRCNCKAVSVSRRVNVRNSMTEAYDNITLSFAPNV